MPGLVSTPNGESFTDYDCDCFEVKMDLSHEIRAYVTNEIDRNLALFQRSTNFLRVVMLRKVANDSEF